LLKDINLLKAILPKMLALSNCRRLIGRVGSALMRGGCVGLLAAVLCGAGVAAPKTSPLTTEQSAPHPTIRDSYHHVAWTAKDGAPVGVWTITQTTDGWLWLGCQSGLYRFDGISFERVDLLPADSLESRSIRAMMATSDGSLWVVFAIGRIARLQASARTTPIWLAGIPSDDRISSLDEDGSGTVLAYTASSNVYAVHDAELRPLGAEWAFPTGKVHGTVVDSGGNFWVATSTGLFVHHKGAQRFERSLANWSNDAAIGVSQAGQMWVADRKGYRPLEVSGTSPPHSSGLPIRSRYDTPELLSRDGSWWIVDCPAGVCRGWPSSSSHSPPSDQFSGDAFTHRDGLSSDRAMTLYEDREGNIWVGTKQGLDRFHKNDFVTVQFPVPVNYFSMVVDAEKGIWTGTMTTYDNVEDYLWKVDPQPNKVPGFSGALDASFEDSDGSMLLGGDGAAWRLTKGQIARLDVRLPYPGARFRTIAKDADGHLWASFQGDRTYRLDDEGWTLKGGLAEVHDGMATAAARDDEGGLWLGFKDNVVSRVRDDQVTNFTGTNGLSLGPVTAMSMGNPALFGGEFGLDVFIDRRFVALHTDQPETLMGITGIARTRNGDLWLNASSGAVRIKAADFNHALKDPAYSMPSRVFNADDGLPAGAQQAVGAPSVVEDKQGRLWFATADGLAWLQPEDVHLAPQPPNVEILGLSTQQRIYAATPHLQLPDGTRNLVIRYTALSLKTPERVQFRFRLSGVDMEWRAMGNVRSANYSNLGPGTYRVQVLASNESGVWNEDGASLEFSIRAAFYQTQWFKAACLAAALLGLFTLLRFQTVRTAARAAARMGERMQERERIARELHDTLLQDVQALGLNLRALHMKYGEGNPVGAELAQLDEAAHRSLAEARARVSGLRVGGEVNELSDSFREFGEQLAALYPAALRVECAGTRVRLHPVAADEIVAIGREALLNAFRHANAKNITVSIAYSPRTFELAVSDDGKGFDFGRISKDDRPGHWGILGMQERSRTLKGELAIEAQASGGTRVFLRVAAAIAYVRT
jgi:signal transduction histidine kinase/ligand-binding sensor domain-containing protein